MRACETELSGKKKHTDRFLDDFQASQLIHELFLAPKEINVDSLQHLAGQLSPLTLPSQIGFVLPFLECDIQKLGQSAVKKRILQAWKLRQDPSSSTSDREYILAICNFTRLVCKQSKQFKRNPLYRDFIDFNQLDLQKNPSSPKLSSAAQRDRSRNSMQGEADEVLSPTKLIHCKP